MANDNFFLSCSYALWAWDIFVVDTCTEKDKKKIIEKVCKSFGFWAIRFGTECYAKNNECQKWRKYLIALTLAN